MLTHALIWILASLYVCIYLNQEDNKLNYRSKMEQWHPNNLKPGFFPRSAESSFNFLFNYNFDPFPGMEMKQPEMMMRAHMGMGMGMGVPATERGECEGGQLLCGDPKKKRLTSEQLESLENSFQEEIKLEPDRKLKLARELGLQPRQVAVWFQNRRARWKTKQLERLYDSLKLQFDAVSRDKQKLQDEVMKLRAMLMDQAPRLNNLNATKQVSIGCTEASGGDETVESTSEAATHGGPAGGSRAAQQSAAGWIPPQQSIAECQYLFSAGDDYNTVASPTPSYWPALPSYPC